MQDFFFLGRRAALKNKPALTLGPTNWFSGELQTAKSSLKGHIWSNDGWLVCFECSRQFRMQAKHLKVFLFTICTFKFPLARQLNQLSNIVGISLKLKNNAALTQFSRRLHKLMTTSGVRTKRLRHNDLFFTSAWKLGSAVTRARIGGLGK